MNNLIDRTDKRINTTRNVVLTILSVALFVYAITKSIVISIMVILLLIIGFVVWDLYDSVPELEKRVEDIEKKLGLDKDKK